MKYFLVAAGLLAGCSLQSLRYTPTLVPAGRDLWHTCKPVDSVQGALEQGHDIVFEGEVLRISDKMSSVQFRVLHDYRGAPGGEIYFAFSGSHGAKPMDFKPGEVWEVSGLDSLFMQAEQPVDGFPKLVRGGSWFCGLRRRVGTAPTAG